MPIIPLIMLILIPTAGTGATVIGGYCSIKGACKTVAVPYQKGVKKPPRAVVRPQRPTAWSCGLRHDLARHRDRGKH